MGSFYLDCRGLGSPMPIVKITTVARDLRPGDELRVDCDDPSFRADVHAWAQNHGFSVPGFEVGHDFQTATLVKR